VGGDGYGSANAMKLVTTPHRHGFEHWEQGVSQAGSGFGDYRHPVLLTPDKTEQAVTGTWFAFPPQPPLLSLSLLLLLLLL
jgi:hypothetical protein